MKPYGLNAMMNKGHCCAIDDVSTRGFYLSARGSRSRRRNKHKRIYKKIQRSYDKLCLRKEDVEYEKDCQS